MAPPKMAVGDGSLTWDMNAPLSRWTVTKAFDSASECDEFKANADEEMSQTRPVFDVGQCIASDDPRLQK